MANYEDMIEEYTAWTVARGYPQLSADELWYDLQARQDDSIAADIRWLSDFIWRWENETE